MTNEKQDSTVQEPSTVTPQRFRRRWGLALGVGLLASLLIVGVVTSIWLPTYRAKSTIYISADSKTLLGNQPSSPENFDTYKKTQMYRATSRMVLDAALNEDVENAALREQGYQTISDLPLVKDQPELSQIDWLLSKLSVSGRQEEFFMIEMEHEHQPKEIAEIVNAVTKVYLRDVSNEDKAIQRQRIVQLAQLNNDQEHKIKKLRSEIKVLSNRFGITGPQAISLKEKAKQTEFSAFEQYYLDSRSELANLKIQHKVAQDISNDQPASDHKSRQELSQMLLTSSMKIAREELHAEQLREEIQKLQDSTDQTEQARLEQSRTALVEQEQKVARLMKETVNDVEASLQDLKKLADANHQLTVAERIKNLTLVCHELEKVLSERDDYGTKLSIDTYELDKMKSEKEKLIASMEDVADRIRTMKIELAAEDRIKLHEKAQVPEKKEYRSLVQHSSIAAGGAFLLAFLLTALIAPRKRM